MKGTHFLIVIGAGALVLLFSTARPTASSGAGAGAAGTGAPLIACVEGSTCTTPGQFCFARPSESATEVMLCEITEGKGVYRLASSAQASSLRRLNHARNGGK
ncbi:hypothetical protein KBC59_03125 [Patescibacteria group bacterium]|nr:hypothetical protein [Patescibacteria group bacterium]